VVLARWPASHPSSENLTTEVDIFAATVGRDNLAIHTYIPGYPLATLQSNLYHCRTQYLRCVQIVHWQMECTTLRQPPHGTMALKELIEVLTKIDALVEAFKTDGRAAELGGLKAMNWSRAWRFTTVYLLEAKNEQFKRDLTPQVYGQLMGLAKRHESHWARFVV
jgi:hypothetical protein